MAFFTLGYRQPYVQRQYARRFPVHPKVPISTTNELVYMACIPIVLYLGLLCYNNRQSRHRFQYISTYTKGFVIMITLVTIWILSNVHYKQEDLPGRHGQFLIDLFDFLWLMSQVSSVIKWFPQVGSCILGVSSISSVLTQLRIVHNQLFGHAFLQCQQSSIVYGNGKLYYDPVVKVASGL